MIYLGLDDAAKGEAIRRYCAEHAIQKVIVVSPGKFRFSHEAEHVEWAEVTLYRVFYRLLQQIDASTLVVVSECLRTQNRNDLSYNCLRLFLAQTTHQIVFQRLPLIETFEDFSILFDFDTRSRWKREKIGPDLLRESDIRVAPVPIEFRAVEVSTDAKTRAAYTKKKRELIDRIGLKDPHTIPRNLYLMSGKSKLSRIDSGRSYVGRNDRFKLDRFTTYREPSYPHAPYTVFELPHNFIDFTDFLALSRQTSIDVLVADLKVDAWYMSRYEAWLGRLRDAYKMLSGAA